MKAYATVEECRYNFIEHVEVLFPLPKTDLLLLYRDIFGLYRIAYCIRDGNLPTHCDEIIEYATTEEIEENEQVTES